MKNFRKMKHSGTIRRRFAFLLALLLLVSTFQVAVFAEDGTTTPQSSFTVPVQSETPVADTIYWAYDEATQTLHLGNTEYAGAAIGGKSTESGKGEVKSTDKDKKHPWSKDSKC